MKFLPKEKSSVVFLLGFSFVLGVLYVFLTPPWQAPDEYTHYEYVHLLSRSKITQIKQQPDPDVQKEIIRSLDRFHVWKYVYEKPPDELPDRFIDSKVLSWSQSKLQRPPLYYVGGSLLLKLFKTDCLLARHYMMRMYSLLISMFTILFTFLSAQIVFNRDFVNSFFAAGFVAFLPQFGIISSSISSDNLANLMGAVSLYLFLFCLKNRNKPLLLLWFPAVITVAFFSGKTDFFIIPAFGIFLLIWLWKNRHWAQSNVLLLLGIAVSLLILGYLLFFVVFNEIGTTITANFWSQVKELGKHFIASRGQGVLSKKFAFTFFKSFWSYPGWMAFPLPHSVYNVLGLFSVLGLAGVIKYVLSCASRSHHKTAVKMESVLLLSAFVLTSFAGTLLRGLPMARYLFPSLAAIAILAALGFREWIPSQAKGRVLMGLLFALIGLNFYNIFIHMTNAFYYTF
ncbi:MAG: DUF2142 domain-containing protein [Candidatus Aminicenantes bacterium]|nr:DUF2142 domain-containing protein [Candidatus Aminicenantes bacterium]